MQQDQIQPSILTIAEVASYLRVSETTIWRWCNSGRLPAFRLGRAWRVRRTDLEEMIDTSSHSEPTKPALVLPALAMKPASEDQ
jgi:excisionase family DNA binding protein